MKANATVPTAGTQDQPWLARKDWAARRVYGLYRVGSVMMVVCLVIFGGSGLSTFVLATDVTSRIVGGVMFALICASCINWLLALRFEPAICRLQTLPGVIGGHIEAVIEATLPYVPVDGLTATLTNVTVDDGAYTKIWRTTCQIPAAVVVREENGRCSIPVRIAIPKPRGVLYAPLTAPLWCSYGEWHLGLTADMPWKNFSATFSVPVYAIDQTPPDGLSAHPPAPCI
jgi:hypothetical protein